MLVVFLIAIFAGYSTATAHDPELLFNQSHQPSYITFAHVGDQAEEKLLFEADIAPPLNAYLSKSSTGSLVADLEVWRDRNKGAGPLVKPLVSGLRWLNRRPFELGFTFVPRVRLRMDNCEGCSKRVRTPSYMPRAIFYYMPENYSSFYHFFSFMVSHHSNGQQGKFYKSDPPLTNEAFFKHIDERTINHVSGNFSTNFWQFNWHIPVISEGLFGMVEYSVEHHPEIVLTEKKLEEQRYARTRLHMQAYGDITQLQLAKITFNARFSYLLNRYDFVEGKTVDNLPGNWIVDLSYYMRSRLMSNFGLFFNYYYGEDFYNIRFNETLHSVRVGIIADPRQLLNTGRHFAKM